MEDRPRLHEEDDGQDAEEKEDPRGGEEVDAHACNVNIFIKVRTSYLLFSITG